MPVAIPRKECSRPRSNSGQFLGDNSDLENAMRKPNTGTHPSAFLDTPGYINCIITQEHASSQRSILRQSVVGQRDHHQAPSQPSDSMHAIVNIQITADSVIRTHVSLFDSTLGFVPEFAPYKSIPDATVFSLDHHSTFDTAIATKSNIDTGPTRGQLMTTMPNQSSPSQDEHGDVDAREAASVLRTLYSVDPSVYSGACEPLAHWIADHVWKVTTQGLSLPLAFIGSSPCTNLPAEPLPVLIESISSLLLSTLIQPSAIILSLFYIARLPAYIGKSPFQSLPSSSSAQRFNTLLLSADSVAQEDPVVQALYASFKLFVLGAILSNKILDDHVFTLKTWHDVSGIPLRVLNELEWLSLDILSHDLFLDPNSWKQWVQTLYSHHLSMRGPISRVNEVAVDGDGIRKQGKSYHMVRHMLEGLMKIGGPQEKVSRDQSMRDSISHSYSPTHFNDNRHAYPCGNGNTNASYSPVTVQNPSPTAPHPTPVFLGIQDRIESKLLDEKLKSEDLDGFGMDDDGPLREEYLPRRRSREAIAPFYQGRERSPTYDTLTGHVQLTQELLDYGVSAPPSSCAPPIPAQSLAHQMETHALHPFPPKINANTGSGNGPPPFKADFAPPTTSLFSFPTSIPNPSSACHSSLPTFGFGLDISSVYAGGAPGLVHPNHNYHLLHEIGQPKVASTLCDYFLSYSRVHVY